MEAPDARPSPTRRGLKRASTAVALATHARCKTIPYEKGTETQVIFLTVLFRFRCKTIPYEKGTETHEPRLDTFFLRGMQDHPLREGD